MRIIIKNLFLTLFVLFSSTAFSKLPDLYKALEHIDSSNKINENSTQKDFEQTIRMILEKDNIEQTIFQKNSDGSISVSQKGEQIAEALFGKSTPNPYLIAESVMRGMQLLLDPVRRDQYNKIRIASNEKVDFQTRLQAIDSLPSIDLQLKMGFNLSNDEAKRGQKLTTEAEHGLINLIKTNKDDILRVAAIKALENSSRSNEETKNELLEIVRSHLIPPQLRMASAEVLWVFDLSSADIKVLENIARDSQEPATFRARVFHTIEIKSPSHVARNLYQEITGEHIEDIYRKSLPSALPIDRNKPRTMYLAKAMGYNEQPGTTYTIGRDNDLMQERGDQLKSMHVQRFKKELLIARESTISCHRVF